MTAIKRPNFNRFHKFKAVVDSIQGYKIGDVINTDDREMKGKDAKPYIKRTLLQYFWKQMKIGQADSAWTKEAVKRNKAAGKRVCRAIIRPTVAPKPVDNRTINEIVMQQKIEQNEAFAAAVAEQAQAAQDASQAETELRRKLAKVAQEMALLVTREDDSESLMRRILQVNPEFVLEEPESAMSGEEGVDWVSDDSTVDKLKQFCEARGIELPKKAKKAEILEIINENSADVDDPDNEEVS